MNRNSLLVDEIFNSVFGDPWHGSSIKSVLENITDENAHLRPIPNAHNIIELILHIYTWTEEVNERLAGKNPSDPEIGDWPEANLFSEKNINEIIEMFYMSTEKLIDTIKNIPEEKFDDIVGCLRDASLGTGTTFEAMIHGVAQHNAYHGGQISLLKKYF